MTETTPALPGRIRTVAWSLVGAAALGFAASLVLDVERAGWSALGTELSRGVLMVLTFVGLGTLLSLRQRANPMGWLLTAGGLTWLVNALAESVASNGLVELAHPGDATLLAVVLNENLWVIDVAFLCLGKEARR